MKNIIIVLFVIFSCLSNSVSLVYAEDKPVPNNFDWTEVGYSTRSCPQFIEDMKTPFNRSMYDATISGVITGMNMAYAMEHNAKSYVGSKTTQEYRIEALKNICMNDPEFDVSTALYVLFQVMKNKGV